MTVLFVLTNVMSTQAKPPGKRPQNPAAIMAEGAPSNAGGRRAQKQKPEDWWVNPCALPDGGNRQIHAVAEDDSRQIPSHNPDLPAWITQLNISITHLKTIQVIYRDIEQHLNADDFKHEWLPEMPIEWLQKQPKKIKEVKAMTVLYEGLQRFAVTIECLLGGPSCTKSKKKEKKNRRQRPRVTRSVDEEVRRALLEEIKFGLKKLLCEVQMILREKKKPSQMLPIPPTSVIIDVNKFMLHPDDSGKMTQDYGVLKRYERYLLQWEKIARESLVVLVKPPAKKNQRESRGRNQKKNKNKEPKESDANQQPRQHKGNKRPKGTDDSMSPISPPRTRHNSKKVVKHPLESLQS